MNIEAKGLDEAIGFLEELATKESKKMARAACRDGCGPLLAQSRANAPVRSGKLKSSLKIKAGGGTKRKGRVSASVVTESKNFYRGDTFYAGMQENGWNQVPTIRLPNGQIRSMKRGTEPKTKRRGTKFMARAVEQAAQAAVDKFSDSLGKRVEALRVKR